MTAPLIDVLHRILWLAEHEPRSLTKFLDEGHPDRERPRRFRNGVALAVPDRKGIEALRHAARYLIAIDRVEEKRHQHRLTKDSIQVEAVSDAGFERSWLRNAVEEPLDEADVERVLART
jgi:hypothetical protein